MEEELRKHRCCFTGHRPEKLHESEEEIKSRLSVAINAAIEDGFSVFISGMARGVDIWAAEVVLDLKETHPEIKLVAASPYLGFEKGWSASWQERYNSILAQSDAVRFICPGYNKRCFLIRNEWMVDRSSLLIAYYDGEAGGTHNTIRYAAEHNVRTVLLGTEK